MSTEKIGVVFLKDGDIVIQSADYIEDGWVIYCKPSGQIELKEIPFGGGEEVHVGFYETIQQAYQIALSLT